jgi:hypothetical protein
MAQHDYIISNQSGSGFRSDLNSALSAIATQNSGSTAPSTTYAYELWADSATGLLKRRNAANSAFIDLGTLDGTSLYLSTLRQRVDNSQLLLQGGSTGGANIELNGPSSGSASNAVYDAAGHYFRSTDGLERYGLLDTTGLAVGSVGTDDARINIGKGATGSRYSYLDLIGDTTYSDYGLRIIRNNTGANTNSAVVHRGTGALQLNAQDTSGSIQLQTQSTTRLDINGTTGHVSCSSGVSGSLTRSTAVTTTSGTSVSFTSLPSWVKRISIHLSGVSLSGTDHLLVRLSTGSSFPTSGYTSTAQSIQGGTASANYNSTAGCIIPSAAAANAVTGTLMFTNITGYEWVGTGIFMPDNDTTFGYFTCGKITLAGTLDGIRLLPTGANTFDAGNVNITYQG